MECNWPLVSVVIVTYNQKEWVGASVRSAIDQAYPNLEVIVADDGSTDGTSDVIRSLAAGTPNGRLVPILASHNIGMSGNVNRGLRAARGSYVAFGAGDDLFLPGKICAQVEWLEGHPDRVLCGHDAELISPDGDVIGLVSARSTLRSGRGAERAIRHGPPVPATSIMARADQISERGFDERLTFNSDWKFQIDCLLSGGEYRALPGVYGQYRIHPNSLTSRIETDPALARLWFEETLMILDEIGTKYPQYKAATRQQRSTQYAIRSWSALRAGARAESRRYARRALRTSLRMGSTGWGSLALAHSPYWAVSAFFRLRSLMPGRRDPSYRALPIP